MGKNPIISVVMPVYNGKKYLRDSIESILNQTYADFEFIIINDGSTDDSLQIIEKYAREDGRIKVVTRENRGLVYSLNEGIGLAVGDYIARMDADDIAFPERFSEQINYFQNHPEVHFLGTNVEFLAESQGRDINICQRMFNSEFETEKPLKNLFLNKIICHPTLMMRKEAIISLHGYSSQYPTSEDYDLFYRAIRRGYKIDKLNKTLLSYRIHSSSKAFQENIDQSASREYILIKYSYLENILKKKKNVLIWGAGGAGRLFLRIMTEKQWDIRIIGFIDQYKSGILEGFPIYKPEDLDRITHDYIIICNTTNQDEIFSSLERRGLEFPKNFSPII